MDKILTSNLLQSTTKSTFSEILKSRQDPDTLLNNIITSINSEALEVTSKNIEAHYIINKTLNPNKDRQSLRAAIASADDEPDKNDVAEVLGYKVKWKSIDHLLLLLKGDLPDFTGYSDKQVVDYVKEQLQGTPRLGVRRVDKWRKEGNLELKVLDHIYHHKTKLATS